MVPLLLGRRKKEEEKKRYEKWPPGTLAWRQGMFWKVVPPPYDIKEPITLKNPPSGAHKFATGKGSAYKTVQVIGGPAPNDIRVDLGVVDIFVKGGHTDPVITFKGGGLLTDVGGRDPSPTEGITIEGIPTEAHARALKRTRTRQPRYREYIQPTEGVGARELRL